jgi:outer membrane protein TolC
MQGERGTRGYSIGALAGLLGSALVMQAQVQESYTLGRAVREAASFPSIRSGTERATAAAAAIRLARTAYLPRVDFIAQANRATRNNVFGMTLPQSVLPAISGPPLMANSMTSVWGSATGFLVSWEPFDFGRRRADVQRAEAQRRRADAAVRRTQLDVAAETADAFLTRLAAEQTVRAAEASVQRSRTVLELVDAQVRAELRPGADASRARAELAAAETQAIQARQAVAEATAALGLYLNRDAGTLRLDPGPLLTTPAAAPVEAASEHPRLTEQQRAIEEVEAARKAIERSWYPRINVQGASYARGTGAMPDGSTLGGVNGLGPNILNWGTGVTVTFGVLDYASQRARIGVEEARIRSEQASLEQIRRELNASAQRAAAQRQAAIEIIRNTPVRLEAARATEQQATARYRAGLATLSDVAEAQRLVTQAEIDDALARLNIWRALLQEAYAGGDLDPFLRAVGQ